MLSNSNDQIIIEYDDNIQPTEEDIIEYAKYIGIDPDQEPELMWIARQGANAPLPKGWKAVHDPQQEELYYFNFETGESIWEHPCDNDYRALVIEERKIRDQKGKLNYRPTDKLTSPSSTLTKTAKSTSTLSDVINNANNKTKLKNDFIFANEFGIEFEDEDLKKKDDDDESEASWQKKSDSEDSDDFRKPVDFGIDRETSFKLDKLNVMLMVGKEKESINVTDSAPSTTREALDSPTRNYIKSVLGASKDEDARRSTKLDSLIEEENSIDLKKESNNKEAELNNLKESLNREFDQRRLELLEDKENRLVKLKQDIELELTRQIESEKKKLQKDQNDKLLVLKTKLENDFQSEKDVMTKKHLDILNSMHKEFENEKQLKKQKFSMQLSKYIKSGKSFDELDEDEEKREIEIYFDHIEKKYSDKLDERKKELQTRYDKKMRDLEEELRRLHEEEAEKKEQQIRQIKEDNLRMENMDKQMDKILAEKVKQFKEKETKELNQLKEDYEIKIKTFKEKYKQLEDNEFKFLENEFSKIKERLQLEQNSKISQLENNLKTHKTNLEKQEEDMRKRLEILQTKRVELDGEWSKLNDREKEIEQRKSNLNRQILQEANESENKLKFEIEKLKLENQDLNYKIESMQKVLDKYYTYQEPDEKTQLNDEDSIKLSEKINKINTKLSQEFDDNEEDEDIENTNDDTDLKSLVKHAKLKLKLKYEKNDLLNSSDLSSSTDDNLTNLNLPESKISLVNFLGKEKDLLRINNEILDSYKIILNRKKSILNRSRNDLKNFEKNLTKNSPNKFKIDLLIDEKNLSIERESLDLEQLELNLRTSKRLIKQKKSLINKLEAYLSGQSISSDTTSSSEESEINDENSQNSLVNFDFKLTKNLNEFLSHVKKSHLNGDLTDHNLNFIQNTLKKLNRINSRLEKLMESIKSYNYCIIEEKSEGIDDSEKIERKWKSYLNEKKYEKMNDASSLGKSLPVSIPSWQANSAYCRLAYDTGSKILDEKWNQYIGYDSMLNSVKRVDPNQFMTTLSGSATSSSAAFNFFPSQVTIPIATQNRLNHHREWIKQFKASGANIN
ncbi:unnamed protein product [Brachionus calyciflorus]|uniref:WW domain-containing protein n=1 Tax=Brachionus calyciflorus TaxID=104777 RepID=A0A813R0F8_9BILA|nr:unnamed protein product [Brachionus calyciflorus]